MIECALFMETDKFVCICIVVVAVFVIVIPYGVFNTRHIFTITQITNTNIDSFHCIGMI
jgi:hypothetical protein